MPKHVNEKTILLANDPKIVICICFGAFWICNKVLCDGGLTINCRLVVFTYTRWLLLVCEKNVAAFSCCSRVECVMCLHTLARMQGSVKHKKGNKT